MEIPKYYSYAYLKCNFVTFITSEQTGPSQKQTTNEYKCECDWDSRMQKMSSSLDSSNMWTIIKWRIVLQPCAECNNCRNFFKSYLLQNTETFRTGLKFMWNKTPFRLQFVQIYNSSVFQDPHRPCFEMKTINALNITPLSLHFAGCQVW